MKISNKSNRTKSNSYLHKTLANIGKLSHWIANSTLYSIVRNILICICSVIFTCFTYLLIQTESPISDVFTTGRISILKDRPANITRDVIVDMSHVLEEGGVTTLTQALIEDIAKKRPNWRLLIILKKGYKHIYNFPKNNNIKLIETTPCFAFFFIVEHILQIRLCPMFHDKLIRLLYYDRIFCDKHCDLVWDTTGFFSYCNFTNIPRISTIHDTAFFDISSKFSNPYYLAHSKICMKNAIDFSKKIITVSEFSQNKICNRFNVSKDFVKHIPIKLGTRLCSNFNFEKVSQIMEKYNLTTQKYFIFCSGWWENKNHSALIKAFHKFAEKNKDIKLILVTPIME